MLLFVCHWVTAAELATTPDFSLYVKVGKVRNFLPLHTNAALHLQRSNLLMITAFPKDGMFGLEYFVTESGLARDHRNVPGWAIQASHRKELSHEAITSLRAAVRELPAACVSPPVGRLVIVSYHEGTNWVSRTYDRDSLSKPMQRIYDILGERFETKPGR
jgi:hypothetical protein